MSIYVFFNKDESYWRSNEVIYLTEFSFHVALVAPVQQVGVSTIYMKGRCSFILYVHHVVKLWVSIL